VDSSKKLQTLLTTARRNADILEKALKKIQPYYPLKPSFRELLDYEEVFIIDSILFRFAKLQDFLGNKIFKTLLEFEGRSVEGVSFWEILKFLEEDGIIEIDLWSMFQEVRREV